MRNPCDLEMYLNAIYSFTVQNDLMFTSSHLCSVDFLHRLLRHSRDAFINLINTVMQEVNSKDMHFLGKKTRRSTGSLLPEAIRPHLATVFSHLPLFGMVDDVYGWMPS